MSIADKVKMQELERRLEAVEKQLRTNGYDCDTCNGVGGDAKGACAVCNGTGRKPKTLTLPDKKRA